MYKIFNNFNPPPVVKNWHFHYYLVPTFSHMTLCGLSNDPHPLRLVHIVMLTQIKSTKRKYPKPWFDSFQMEMFQFDKKNYSSLSWHAFSKMRLHNLPAIVVQWTPTSQDEARTLLPPEEKKKKSQIEAKRSTTKIFSSSSLYAFSKMKLHNHTAIAVQWTPTSQDKARTLLPPEYKKKCQIELKMDQP